MVFIWDVLGFYGTVLVLSFRLHPIIRLVASLQLHEGRVLPDTFEVQENEVFQDLQLIQNFEMTEVYEEIGGAFKFDQRPLKTSSALEAP
ncbi:hypothetical protein Tco_1570214 [Tanacetum coccineum]